MLAQRPSKRQPATHSLPHLCQDPHMGQEKASSRPLAHVVPHVDPAWARSSQASQAGIGWHLKPLSSIQTVPISQSPLSSRTYLPARHEGPFRGCLLDNRAKPLSSL